MNLEDPMATDRNAKFLIKHLTDRQLVISDAAHQMMAAYSADGDRVMRGGVRLPDGMWQIDVDADLVSALAEVHADPSTAIIALCSEAMAWRGAAVGPRCSFAWPGTFGHECGAPAVLVGQRPSKHTKNGVFYAFRCASCAKFKGGENRDYPSFVPIDPAVHRNEWK